MTRMKAAPRQPGDHRFVTTLCPCGNEVTHRFKPGDTEQAYELLGEQRDGNLKVAITP